MKKVTFTDIIWFAICILVGLMVMRPIGCSTAHGQERPRVQGNTVRLEVQSRQGDPNLPAARLAEWLRSTVVVSPEVQARYVVRLSFTGFDTQIKPTKTSIGRETGAATANTAIQAVGQAVASAAYRYGGQVAGSVGGTAAQTASQTAAQQVQNEIRYGTSKTGIVQLQYQLCLGPRCDVGKATAYFRVQIDMDQSTQWARFAVLSASNDRKKLQILQPSLYLGEGNQSSQQDFMQQALLELLLNDANAGWPRMVGRGELETLRGLLHPQVKATSEVEPPAIKRQRPAEHTAQAQQLAEQVAELKAEVERLKSAQPKITMDLPPQPTPTPLPKPAPGCINCQQEALQPMAGPFVAELKLGDGRKDNNTSQLNPQVQKVQDFLATVLDRNRRPLLVLKPQDTKGVFGPATQTAVRLFQALNSLPQNGAWDAQTLAKANEVWASK